MPRPSLRSGSLAPAVVWPCSRRGAALVASSLQALTPSPRRAAPSGFGVPLKPAIRRRAFITLRRLWSSPFAHRGRAGSALTALPPASTAWGPNFPKPVGPASLRSRPSGFGDSGLGLRPRLFFGYARLPVTAPAGLGAPPLSRCFQRARSPATAGVAVLGCLLRVRASPIPSAFAANRWH